MGTNKLGNQYDRLAEMGGTGGELDTLFSVNPLTGVRENADPVRGGRLGRRYSNLYDRFTGRGGNAADLGTYSQSGGVGSWNPFTPPAAPADPNLPPAKPPPDPKNPNAGDAAGAGTIDMSALLDAMIKGLPAGLDLDKIGTEAGARAMEVLYPLVKDAYNMRMQQGAIDLGYQGLDEIKQDPTLNATAKLVTDKLANPFTYDDATVALMRSRTSDTIANQEASMRDRLQSMGARQGISPDSPLYASMAAQAVMARDINLANAERDLDIELARQKSSDRDSAIATGAGWGGSYQTMLQQAYGNLGNLYSGGKLTSVANPFEGLTDSLMLSRAISDARPSGLERVSSDMNSISNIWNQGTGILKDIGGAVMSIPGVGGGMSGQDWLSSYKQNVGG